MKKINFTEQELKELVFEAKNNDNPKIRQSAFILLLKSKKLKHKAIMHVLGISKPTIAAFLKAYQTSGIDGLKQLDDMDIKKGRLER
ncbi:helix-turn-helix domain-containing protein [Lachnospiraceae bacterium ZAX-1]